MKKDNIFVDLIMLLITIGIFFVLIWLAIKGYPWFLGLGVASFTVPFLLICIYSFYCGWKEEKYLQKSFFEIWMKGQSPSLRSRLEYRRIVRSLDDPYLNKLRSKRETLGKTCLRIWLIVFLSGCLLIAILQAVGVLKYT
ncbi:MAG: hypothetical protein JSV82_01955 [Planctomycetota bacterium]|nr:MAG: hypothetical protein JSV82_01955 [Planctomycetota bacterium]